MERWRNRVAVVTGASSGIGAATLKDLVHANVTVVGLCRNPARICKVQQSLPLQLQSRVHPFKCDVRDEQQVKDVFKWVDENFGGTDILVNSAGIFEFCSMTKDSDIPVLRNIFETNLMGTFYCTREAFQSMKKRNFDGHIVCLNSTDGHHIPMMLDSGLQDFGMYATSKFALTAMVETFRQEFINEGTRIRISSISPGVVHSSIADNLMNCFDMPGLLTTDISSAILYCLGTPPHVQVHEMIIKPLGEAF